MATSETKNPAKRAPVHLLDDVHRALKLRAVIRSKDIQAVADEILRADLAAEIEQIKAATPVAA